MSKTIQQYFQEAMGQGAIDFRLRVLNEAGHLRFYIHPDDRDGDTEDYFVVGNLLIPFHVDGFEAALKEHVADLGDPMPLSSCPLCLSVIGEELYERPWFVALGGGMTTGTDNEPAEPYVNGAQLCPHCGHIWEIDG